MQSTLFIDPLMNENISATDYWLLEHGHIAIVDVYVGDINIVLFIFVFFRSTFYIIQTPAPLEIIHIRAYTNKHKSEWNQLSSRISNDFYPTFFMFII